MMPTMMQQQLHLVFGPVPVANAFLRHLDSESAQNMAESLVQASVWSIQNKPWPYAEVDDAGFARVR